MNKSIEAHYRAHDPPPDAFAGSNRVSAAESGSVARGELILEPEEMDILCGQDKTFRRHAGNQAFKEIIATYANTYDEASRQDKMAITEAIVESLENVYNARFIRPVPNGWQELSRTRARDKVSHALRWVVVGKGRTTKARKMRQGSSSFDGNKSSSDSLSSTLSTESEPSPGLPWEDWDGSKQVQCDAIDSQLHNNLQRRQSFPPMDSERINVADARATTKRCASEPNMPIVHMTCDQHCIELATSPVNGKAPDINASSPEAASAIFPLSSFDEVLTSSELVSLVRAPLLPDSFEDLERL